MTQKPTIKNREKEDCLFCDGKADRKLITDELPHKPICRDCYLSDAYIGKGC